MPSAFNECTGGIHEREEKREENGCIMRETEKKRGVIKRECVMQLIWIYNVFVKDLFFRAGWFENSAIIYCHFNSSGTSFSAYISCVRRFEAVRI